MKNTEILKQIQELLAKKRNENIDEGERLEIQMRIIELMGEVIEPLNEMAKVINQFTKKATPRQKPEAGFSPGGLKGLDKDLRCCRPTNEADLVSFGEYLLSDERRENIAEGIKPEEEVPAELSRVHDADISNWREKRRKEKFGHLEGFFIDPEQFKARPGERRPSAEVQVRQKIRKERLKRKREEEAKSDVDKMAGAIPVIVAERNRQKLIKIEAALNDAAAEIREQLIRDCGGEEINEKNGQDIGPAE